MHVRDQQQHGRKLLPAADTEFRCLLDGRDRVATRVGDSDDLRLGALRLEQEGREVGGVQRVEHRAHHFAAIGFDDGFGVGRQLLAEGVVRRQDEPALVAFVDHGGGRAARQGVGRVRPLHAVGRALRL
ncbi:hypothetical protein D3C72_1456450 [compost metagenome]